MQPNPDNKRPITVPSRQQQTGSSSNDKELAAALMKEQINRLYDEGSNSSAQDDNPYEQSQENAAPNANNSWEKYHTAWQQYYQQYYQRYYMAEQEKLKRQYSQTPPAQAASRPAETFTQDEAVDEIRNDLLSKVKAQSKNLRKNRHFVPAISALIVMLLFLFLQYNRVMVAQVTAYVSPASISAETVLMDAIDNAPVGKEPRMLIPKINVDAPVVYGVESLAEGPIQEALKDGIVHYPIPGASSLPGEKGNGAFLGHSSNDVFDDGKYKFVFVELEKMKPGDTFYIHYEEVRYVYRVTETETILPTQVDKLIRNSDKPTVTLITCTPFGTAEKRFLVHGEQISPDPTKAVESTNQNSSAEPAVITGNSPTLFERLFGS